MIDLKNSPAKRIALGAGVAVVAVVAFLLWPRHERATGDFTGYVVSDDLYMTSPVAGTVGEIAVRRGQRVAAGQPLFSIDPTVRAAAADRARAGVSASEAQAAQQQAALGRASANLAAAQADAVRAQAELARLLAARGDNASAVAAIEIERARAAAAQAIGRRDAAQTEATGARAGIDAAKAGVAQARAGLAGATRELGDLAPRAPKAGRVIDIMYRPGESIAANAAVIAITPDDEVKIRFYAPERRVAEVRPGTKVAVACDGCAAGLTATVEFVAARPEYTPPVIYSLDVRDKLVFMVEAAPDSSRAFTPGQPLNVSLLP
ncbi:HlyD family secretion protein [Phenylobacterium immobile]|uniref:HlyD family secretion protein n=1 Tax=Phenylobacterium immobile TaxID=21 RepID=UPI000A57BE1C|nr:HlyD family efflux transporter periplasmic adaptor subunit [Phenylobacterium immobile]